MHGEEGGILPGAPQTSNHDVCTTRVPVEVAGYAVGCSFGEAQVTLRGSSVNTATAA